MLGVEGELGGVRKGVGVLLETHVLLWVRRLLHVKVLFFVVVLGEGLGPSSLLVLSLGELRLGVVGGLVIPASVLPLPSLFLLLLETRLIILALLLRTTMTGNN